jgi:hypothetical protein
VLDLGGDERLSWSLTSALPGTPLEERCGWPAPAGLRGLARQAAGLELISVVRALDMETRLGVPRPPLLTWLAEDYPGLFAAPDLDKRLWSYAIAYTIRHIVFWPPDRPESAGLDPAHPLRTLRCLIDAPLPRTSQGIP